MEIITGLGSGRQTHIRQLSIEGIEHGYESWPDDTVHPHLIVSLKSHRWHGARKKEFPAKLIVRFDELQKMVTAFERELRACYQVLEKEGLFDKLREARDKKPALERAVIPPT